MIQKNIYKSSYSYMVAFFCFLFFGIATSNAQSTSSSFIDSLSNKITNYGAKHHTPEMFVHFDKTIYSNNENVWLTAYLLDSTGVSEHTTLIVNLIKDDTRTVVLDNKFVMNKGLAFGNFFIPDSVAAGSYTLVAYTNLMLNGIPYIKFKQPITIKTSNQASFTAQLAPVDTAITSAEMRVRLMANISAVDLLPNAEVNYYVGNPANHLLSGKVKTDASGQYVFSIPSKILSPGSNKLYVRVRHKGEEKEISMALPVASQLPVVNFYPEGGNLVNGLQSYVGWETKTAGGTPVSVNAILYKDDKAVDTIETNGYGMGKFLLVPKSGSKYIVKISDNTSKGYDLPAVLTDGPVISTQHALANDTLSIMLQNTNEGKLFLLVHNYRQLFSATPIVVNKTARRVKILLNEVPKGINQLTIIDSLGRPFAQRSFFAHYNRKQSLQINADSEFGTRQKVNIKVKLNNKDTSALALVSIAAVQENRIETKKRTDIESYFYLTSQLGDLPVKEDYLGSNDDDKQFLENILLIKGWSRYKWTDVLKVSNKETTAKLDKPVLNGLVTTIADKPIKKPVTLILLNQEGVSLIQTDSTGKYIINENNLITAPNKKLGIIISGDNASNYKLNLFNPYSKIYEQVPSQLSYTDYSNQLQRNTASMQLSGNERIIQLKEVVIKDKNDKLFYGATSNECGDYVCRYGVLNCPNHGGQFDNKLPVKGQSYRSGIQGNNTTVYAGCVVKYPKDNSISFKGIYEAVDFYPSDYSVLSPSQPDYVSTIYWKHLAKITAGKETNFSFYTSDITGRFKIIIQGVANDDVIYSEKTFNVAKAK